MKNRRRHDGGNRGTMKGSRRHGPGLAVLTAFAAAACILPSLVGAERAGLKPAPSFAAIAMEMARKLPREHLLRLPVDDMIAERAWENYLDSLDGEHIYFLESDISKFKMQTISLDDNLLAGNVSFAYDVFQVFKERLRDRCAYVESLAQKGFNLETNETYRWKRKDAPWARDRLEWDEVWRKRTKNFYVQRVVSAELDREKAAAAAPDGGGKAPEKTHDGDGKRDAGETEPKKDTPADPWDSMLKGYRQLLTVVEDYDADWVLQVYLTAFARAYDPHCEYMSPPSFENFEIEMKLSLVGIGAVLVSEDGAAKIQSIIPGGPADRDKRETKLRANDKIIAVGQGDGPQEDVLHWPLQKVVGLIRGEKGTKVALKVIPASDPTGSTTKIVDLIRDEVKLEGRSAKQHVVEVKGKAGATRKLGVVRIPTFYADLEGIRNKAEEYKSSTRDVAKILAEMNTNGVEGVLLDLRNNPGGSLMEARTMTGLFIRNGPVVIVRDGRGVGVLGDDDPSVAWSGPLVVLVNRQTASASEILAGALQDYGRALVVGDSKTHGKGTVQTVVPLSETEKLGSLKFTTALFYRITGSSTQLKGVSSDVVIPSPGAYLEIGEDYLKNPLQYGMTRPCRFRRVGDLAGALRLIGQNAAERLENDKRLVAYKKLLGRVEALYGEEELPLNIAARRETARTTRELQDQLSKLVEDEEVLDEEAPDKKDKQDLVLDEALNILSDLIECLAP